MSDFALELSLRELLRIDGISMPSVSARFIYEMESLHIAHAIVSATFPRLECEGPDRRGMV